MDIRIIDICLPDYFPGSSAPYLAIDLTHGMTRSEVEGAILRAVDDEAFAPEGFTEADYGKLRRLLNARLTKYLLSYSRNMPTDEERGTEEPVYAYIAVLP
ncbi:hypothetical protein [Acidithiobacillus caldus]|uniref:Uncharacterized protein n=1 Tax=Acidithiobacillus caldus TaxID=33059 RepID=A0A1E7YNU1_9PROT|nr:hypothetical protein [Acidithiobacillus caldus]OFC36617.1 hypothetical protein BAE27_05990 [Acidithiobacillus caldus]OFC38231.1 hypothetical protein BAE29_09245 [Acidithiobacillus caldus]OFC39311.1 hypothetical protein BAE28_03840 [Acidithiobacillus caldus]OFC62420.1 hypothetical protein BAE30_02030 [Acidithiobacillus caldus]